MLSFYLDTLVNLLYAAVFTTVSILSMQIIITANDPCLVVCVTAGFSSCCAILFLVMTIIRMSCIIIDDHMYVAHERHEKYNKKKGK